MRSHESGKKQTLGLFLSLVTENILRRTASRFQRSPMMQHDENQIFEFVYSLLVSEGVKASLSMGLSQKLVSSVDFMIQQLEVFFEARRRSFDSFNDTRYPMCNRIRTIAANVRDRRSFLLLIFKIA